jgi:hypothetical protein
LTCEDHTAWRTRFHRERASQPGRLPPIHRVLGTHVPSLEPLRRRTGNAPEAVHAARGCRASAARLPDRSGGAKDEEEICDDEYGTTCGAHEADRLF